MYQHISTIKHVMCLTCGEVVYKVHTRKGDIYTPRTSHNPMQSTILVLVDIMISLWRGPTTF